MRQVVCVVIFTRFRIVGKLLLLPKPLHLLLLIIISYHYCRRRRRRRRRSKMASQDKLSVEYFRDILDDQTKNLNILCERWSKVLELTNEDVDPDSEEALGSIRATIGKAKLLISQRFKQFSELIDDCEFNKGQHSTRLNDLLGFWDMISFQVDDVKRKFESLDEAKRRQEA